MERRAFVISPQDADSACVMLWMYRIVQIAEGDMGGNARDT